MGLHGLLHFSPTDIYHGVMLQKTTVLIFTVVKSLKIRLLETFVKFFFFTVCFRTKTAATAATDV
jgi:hypothetical protein